MGIDVFEMCLTTPSEHVYKPGDIVAGTIRVIATPDVDLKEGVTIIIYGFAFVQWDEQHGDNSYTYTGHEELFKKCIVQTVNPQQQTDYPFFLQIPNIPALPWTTETSIGKIQYGVNAIINRPWYKLGNLKAKVKFKLQSSVHMRLVPNSRNQHYYGHTITQNREESDVGFCCFPLCFSKEKEKVAVTLKSESLWAYPGDIIDFSLSIRNISTQPQSGKAKVKLVGCWFFQASLTSILSKDYAKNKLEEKVYEEVNVDELALPPGTERVSKGKIKIPFNLTPTQVECDVMRLTYKLIATMDDISVPCCIGTAPTVEVDVVVGSASKGSAVTKK